MPAPLRSLTHLRWSGDALQETDLHHSLALRVNLPRLGEHIVSAVIAGDYFAVGFAADLNLPWASVGLHSRGGIDRVAKQFEANSGFGVEQSCDDRSGVNSDLDFEVLNLCVCVCVCCLGGSCWVSYLRLK